MGCKSSIGSPGVVIIVLLLSACGGGGGSGSDTPAPTPNSDVSFSAQLTALDLINTQNNQPLSVTGLPHQSVIVTKN